MRYLLTSIVALLALAAPASAAEWQRASLITPPFAQVPTVLTSVSAAGETLVVWEDSNTLIYRTRVRGEDAGSPAQIATDVSRTYTLAADRQGNAAVAWVVSNGGADNAVLVSLRPAGGQFGAAQVVSAEETQASQLQVALAPTGEAVIAWHDLGLGAGQRRLRTAARAPGAGSFGPVSTLAQGEPLLRALRIDDRGNALAAWTEADGVKVASRRSGGAFAPAQSLITQGSQLKGELQLAVRRTGDALLAFTEGPPDGRVTSAHVAVAYGSTSGEFDPPEVVSGPFARDLAIDIDDGQGGVVWRAGSGRNSRVQALATLAEDLGQTQTLSGRNARRPDVAVTANGRVTVAWERLTDRGRAIEATTRGSDPRFGSAERVSTYGGVIAPDVEANARGEQFVAWTRNGRGLSRAESAKASSLTGRFTRVLTIFDGRTRAGETVDTVRLEPTGNVMQAAFQRRITEAQRLFWDLSTYGEPPAG